MPVSIESRAVWAHNAARTWQYNSQQHRAERSEPTKTPTKLLRPFSWPNASPFFLLRQIHTALLSSCGELPSRLVAAMLDLFNLPFMPAELLSTMLDYCKPLASLKGYPAIALRSLETTITHRSISLLDSSSSSTRGTSCLLHDRSLNSSRWSHSNSSNASCHVPAFTSSFPAYTDLFYVCGLFANSLELEKAAALVRCRTNPIVGNSH